MPLQNVGNVAKRLQISISNVLLVSVYNTLTTKPTVKIFYWKKNAMFFLTKSLIYQFSIPTTEPRLFLSMPMFHLNPYLWSKEELSI